MEALQMLLAEDNGKSGENRHLGSTLCVLALCSDCHVLLGPHSPLFIIKPSWQGTSSTHLPDGETEAQGKGRTCQRISSV